MSLPVFSQSFRICFLVAAIWAGAAVPLWLLAYTGYVELGGPYGPAGWHAHELIFGYVALVIAGFLFTALPNWTGRPPIPPARIKLLFALWVAGRIGVAAAGVIGIPAAAALDALFLIAVIATALREIVGGSNYRNLVVVGLVGILLAANLWMHAEAWRGGAGAVHMPLHAGIAIIVALIVLIGGRIVPNFTRNWLARQRAPHLPAMPSRLDKAAMAASGIALVSWVAAPEHKVTGVLALIAGILLVVRLSRWRGWETGTEPLLTVLHVGYLFVPLGFLLIATQLLPSGGAPADSALHAWTTGAVGLMTLAVMTRASLGHSGQPLTADMKTRAIYVAVFIAAILRVVAPMLPDQYIHIVGTAGIFWTLAFVTFVVGYGPLLLKPRAGSGA